MRDRPWYGLSGGRGEATIRRLTDLRLPFRTKLHAADGEAQPASAE
jgi:hypothetical protein